MAAAAPEHPIPPAPVVHGPTWSLNPDWDGADPLTKYLLPEHTLGWHILHWIHENLLADDHEGEEDEEDDLQAIFERTSENTGPFMPTPEQARFILWMYAVDVRGRFIFRDIILQRLKGWGKDPLAAVIAAVEFIGPSQFAGWQAAEFDPATGTLQGQPVGKRHPRAWVQVAAVSREQTKNTMTIFAGLFNERCKAVHGIDLGKEIIYAHSGQCRIESVTSSPKSMEGNRPTFVILNETHHWLENNDGVEMNKVIKRNIRKNKRGKARTLSITNAYNESEHSVAQRRRETWEEQEAGRAIKTGVLYDSVEAHPDALLSFEMLEGESAEQYETRVRLYITEVIAGVRGDAWWLNIEEIVNAILDGETDISDARRFYYNQVGAAEDAWLDPAAIKLSADPLCVESRRMMRDDPLRAGWIIRPEEELALFFDGSKSRDATGLVACRISDGHIFTMGIWAPPPTDRHNKWRAPRGEVDARVREIFNTFRVVAFFADPSHAQDDDPEGGAYWDTLIDGWHRDFKDDLLLWSLPTGHHQHSIMWDMSSPTNQKEFVFAAERFVDELEARNDIEELVPTFMHDAHPALVKHLGNARAYDHPKGWGTSLWKGSTGGKKTRKHIDLAVCAVGARMVRRLYLNRAPEDKRKEPGTIWGLKR